MAANSTTAITTSAATASVRFAFAGSACSVLLMLNNPSSWIFSRSTKERMAIAPLPRANSVGNGGGRSAVDHV